MVNQNIQNTQIKQDPPYVLTKYDVLGLIMEECPRAAELLAEYGLHCISCYANQYDTLEMGAQVHGMTDEEMQEMIDEINAELEKEWREENKTENLKSQMSELKSTSQMSNLKKF